MTLKQYIPVLLIGCIAIFFFLLFSLQNPGFISNNSTVRLTPVPIYPAENISTTVYTPRGTMIIDAQVPESYQVMPVYRLNLSERHTLNIDRNAMFPGSYDEETNLTRELFRLPDGNEAQEAAEKILQKFDKLPLDATIYNITKREGNSWYSAPDYSIAHYRPYTRVSYARIINGLMVDNWGINHENVGMVTDHDFTIVGLQKDGDPLFVTQRWTKSEFVRDEPVISVRESFDRLRQWQYADEDYGSIYNLKVHSIRQGYYEATGFTSIIEPAWFFNGENDRGYNQTVVVLARKNDSVLLPFYNWSHKDPSLPDWRLGIHYEEWSGKKEIGMNQALEMVKKFSGSPDLIIFNTTPFEEGVGCGEFITLYNITTNEGTYIVDPKISSIREVRYNISNPASLQIPIEYPQALNTSVIFINEKYGYRSFESLAANPEISECPDSYRLTFLISNSTVTLNINKKTGRIESFVNRTAMHAICV